MTVAFSVRVMSLVDATFTAALNEAVLLKIAAAFDTMFPLHVSCWASVSGFAWGSPNVLAALHPLYICAFCHVKREEPLFVSNADSYQAGLDLFLVVVFP